MKNYHSLFLIPFLFSFNLFAEISFQSENQKLKLVHIYKTNDVVWGFDFIDQDNLIFTEKSGKIKILNLKTKNINELKGLPKILFKGQGGLLDIAYNKTYRHAFITYSVERLNASTTALAKFKITNEELKDLKTIYIAKTNSAAGQHFGSRIAFQGEYLFLGIGDRGKRYEAQKLDNHHGKIIRIKLDGTIPEDNPFYKTLNKTISKIWSYGHRNPQGLAIDSNGSLWEAEFGPKGGDEINLIFPAKNYGWPIITYGREYYGPKIGTTHKEGMEQPIIHFTPSISPSGINFYTGDKIKNWENNLFLANLSSKHLRRLVIVNNKILKQEVLLEQLKERIRHVRTSPDGRLFISTDSGLIAAIDIE